MIPYLRWGHVGEVLDDETVVLFWFHWPIVDHHVTVAMTTVAVVNLPIHCNRNSNYCNHSCAGDCYPQLHTVTHPKHTHTQNKTKHFPHVLHNRTLSPCTTTGPYYTSEDWWVSFRTMSKLFGASVSICIITTDHPYPHPCFLERCTVQHYHFHLPTS